MDWVHSGRYEQLVRAGIVFEEKDYIYSSHASRSGLVKGLLKLFDFRAIENI